MATHLLIADAAVGQDANPLLLVLGAAALLKKEVSEQVVASIRLEKVQALLLEFRESCFLGVRGSRRWSAHTAAFL